MSWPRGSRIAALLVILSPLASADSIKVNTTTDDYASNSLCSLREAVEYFNRDKPDGGWMGCVRSGDSSTTDTITLPASSTAYQINGSAIVIRRGLTISGSGITGSNHTTIQVNGLHRAFIVNDTPSFIAPPCASSISAPCSLPAAGSSAAAPDLDTASDTGVVTGDYLTMVHDPVLKGVTPRPTGSTDTLTITLYDNPKGADPVKIGVLQLSASSSSDAWTQKSSVNLLDGVHYITYTTQLNAGFDTPGPLSAPSSKLTVAIYSPPGRRSVTLSQLEIKGCGTTGCDNNANDTTTIFNDPAAAGYDPYGLTYTFGLGNTYDTAASEGHGGVIYNEEDLSLESVLLSGGFAAKGGAIYVDADGVVSISNTEVSNNTAVKGAGVYLEKNSLTVEKSLFRLNTAPGAGAVLYVADSASASGLSTTSEIQNATISGNTALALSGTGGVWLNSSTVVLNTGGGVDFRTGAVGIYNTILAGNTGGDCLNLPASPVVMNSLVLSAGTCPTAGNSAISGAAGTTGQLMAVLDSAGHCNGDFGILCPLADNDGTTQSHLPRLLPGYAALSDSPLVNKASPKVGTLEIDACPSQDQRGKTRVANACDIGAIELQPVSGAVSTGGAITYGQTYTQSLADNLADEELLPVTQCPAQPPTTAVAGSYRQDVPGCPWLEIAPPRGMVRFNTDGSYSYIPDYNFHGFDRFTIRVMTTLSKLNSQPESMSRPLSAQVVDAPPGGISNSSLGGALDGWELLLLGVLGMRRRRERGE